MKYKITTLQKLILGWIADKIVIQSEYHRRNIIEYYKIIADAAKEQFTEDNADNLEGFLMECFSEANQDIFGDGKDILT